MYLASVVLLMLVFPATSIYAEHAFWHAHAPLMLLVGKWFVFWGAGVRLFMAGLRQFFQPRFTSEEIFGIKSEVVLPIVRELGVANFATGTVGILSIMRPSFVLPVAIIAAIFYGIAGVRHVARRGKLRNENVAMISDIFACVVFAA
ncbi:MAG TPA: DUF6790 family protein [Candidatus Acidoferrales bacterium]